jgi:hypothetical protein
MAAAPTTHLPAGVKSLSELIGIESTTQATLYVATRDIVDCFRCADKWAGWHCNLRPSRLRVLHYTVSLTLIRLLNRS